MVSSIDTVSQVEVIVFPNPTRDWLRFTLYDYVLKSGQLRLYDMNGQLAKTKGIRQEVNQLELTTLVDGTYFSS